MLQMVLLQTMCDFDLKYALKPKTNHSASFTTVHHLIAESSPVEVKLRLVHTNVKKTTSPGEFLFMSSPAQIVDKLSRTDLFHEFNCQLNQREKILN